MLHGVYALTVFLVHELNRMKKKQPKKQQKQQHSF
jgi:hypothetical protein